MSDGAGRETATILVVDDYEAGRYATGRILRQAGFEVREAGSGEEALVEVARSAPDLVLLDVNLPDMDGFEVCRRIKSEPTSSDTPVLYLSAAYRAAEHRVHGLDLGADGYLTQPIDPRELIATIHALLRARHVRAAVRRSEERFRALLIATSDVVWTTDAAGEVVEELPDWAAFTGQRFEEYRGHGWLDAVHPEDRARTAEGWRRATEERSVYEVEYRLLRHDGEYRLTYVRGVPVLEADGGVREWVGANTDITERRRAEEELQDRNERLQFLADATSHLLLTRDPREYLELLFLQLSAHLGLEIYLNYMMDESGATLRLVSWRGLPEERVAPFREMQLGASISGFVAERRRGLVVEDIQHRDDAQSEVLRENGLTAYASFPLLGEDRLIGTLAFGTRSRTRFQPDELALMETVCNQVAVATERARFVAELRERARALEEANRAKADFLATMSHELRTPLNAILGYSDLLLLGVPEPLTDASREQIDRIRGAGTHLSLLIEEVLTHARIEAGRDELHLDRVQVDLLVTEVSALVEPLARQKGLRFTVVHGPHAEEVDTDPQKLRQILLNLLGNAVKFTDQGEVRLEVGEHDGRLRFVVRDTGIGIAPEYHDRVFEPFWQVDGTRTRRAGGTGLGLGVVRQLVERLGGTVALESEEGTGSAFTVEIPG